MSDHIVKYVEEKLIEKKKKSFFFYRLVYPIHITDR